MAFQVLEATHVICARGGAGTGRTEAGGAIAFLHENFLHFIGDEGMEDAAMALAYLSDAGVTQLTAPSLKRILSSVKLMLLLICHCTQLHVAGCV